LISQLDNNNKKYEAILAVVAHDQFKKMDLKKYLVSNGLVYDVKAIYPKEMSDLRL